MIKRKSRWVSRYAQIKDAFFQYKEDRYDIKARYMIDLRKAEVRKGKLDNDRQFIQVTERILVAGQKKGDVVRITFNSEEEYRRWGAVFVEGAKSDQELINRKQDEMERAQEE